MTRVDWAENARRLREHAAADAERRTADTGEAHKPDPAVMRIAASCDAATYCPDRPNPRLEKQVAAALATRPAASPHTGNFDLSSRPGHRPDTRRP